MGKIILSEESSVSTPSANHVAVYPKSDGRIYKKADDGVEGSIGGLDGGTATSVTISGGIATLTGAGTFTLDTEGSTATDDLDKLSVS